MPPRARPSVYELAAGGAPQWWVWMSSALAWLWIAALELKAPASGLGDICRAPREGSVLLPWLGGWTLMVVAMMYPLLGEPIRKLAMASAASRRARATAIFLAGYTFPWLAFGLGCGVLSIAKDSYLGARADPSLAVAGFALAAIWAWTPARRHALQACRSAAPSREPGWPADVDCLRHGGLAGWNCVLSCWAAMAALALTHHGAVTMAVVTVLLLVERHRQPYTGKLLGFACAAAAAHSAFSMLAASPAAFAGYLIG